MVISHIGLSSSLMSKYEQKTETWLDNTNCVECYYTLYSLHDPKCYIKYHDKVCKIMFFVCILPLCYLKSPT